MPKKAKPISDKDIEEFKKEEMQRGRYPTEAEELGGEGGEEYIILKRDKKSFSERIKELENSIEIYESMLEGREAEDSDLRSLSGEILQKYNSFKKDLDTMLKEDSAAEEGIAENFKKRLKNIELKMRNLGI